MSGNEDDQYSDLTEEEKRVERLLERLPISLVERIANRNQDQLKKLEESLKNGKR